MDDAWLATRNAPEAECPLRRLVRMAALTRQYPVRLVEMPAAEYISIKQREWRENVVRV